MPTTRMNNKPALAPVLCCAARPLGAFTSGVLLSVLCGLALASCGGAGGTSTAATLDPLVVALLDEGQRAEQARGVAYDLGQARAAYARACEAGSQRGCALLGQALMRGPSRGREVARALALTRAACDAGELLGCTHHGWVQSQRLASRDADEGGSERMDREGVCALHARACVGGEPTGCVRHGRCLQDAPGASDDHERQAAELFTQACEGRDGEACGELARLCESGQGVERDLSRALKLYRRACDWGSPRGCDNLGRLYDAGRDEDGAGVERDHVRAAALYGEACERGDPHGCASLGDSYNEGRGVARNERRAASLYRRACDAGAGHGCAALGSFYEHGRAVGSDLTRALELYRLACALRDGGGCNDLGVLYFDGRGVERSEARAIELYRDACELGASVPCSNLATILGRGTNGYRAREDVVESARLYGLACERGEEVACRWQAIMLVRAAWAIERTLDPSVASEQTLALYRQACALRHLGACLHVTVMEGRPVEGAREWQIEILETANAPSWIAVGDVCHAIVLTGAPLVHLRVTCHGRFIYPPGSVIHWLGEDAVVDDLTTTDNADARLLMDASTGVFVLEDDEQGFLPNVRLVGRLHAPPPR